MSDSPEDRRHRGRRGSLLDHARDAQSSEPASARQGANETARPGQPSAAASPSLLTAPNRSARVSTSRYADHRSVAPARPAQSLLSSAPASSAAPSEPVASAPAASVEARQPASLRKTNADRERFGDRISRLIGTIAPESKPAEPRLADAGEAAEPPEPARPEEHRRQEARSQRRPQPENWPEYGADASVQPAYRPREGHSNGDDHYHWHAASAGGQFEDGNRPLLDASILISAVWRFRRLIVAATLAGAVIGVLMALSTPHRYYAESRLFVDPREIRVTEDDIRNQQLSTEAMLAITDSQLQILSSTSVLEKVIEDLGLDRDPEFNGSMAPGGISGGISLIRELFTGKNPATEGEQKALNNLRDALSVGRDARTFVIIVGVDTRDPEKSALIANQIVETYLDSEGQAQSNLLERTSESIDTRINSLRADLDAAEREVERFKAENGLVGVGGQYIDDKEILALSDQLANARAMKVGIRVKADNLARVKIDDVLSGAFPEELLSSNLSELRKQYAQTKSNAESLATRLGPRHPQYISAMQSLETITNEISAELRRIVASSQTELQRAVETEQELASQMAVAKSRAIDQSVELVTLRELERKANATRGIYEAFLTRSRETSERSNLSTRNVRVISPAEAPLQPMGPSRKFIAIGGMMAGFLAGFGLALLAGAVESVRAYNSALHQARYPGPSAGGHPQPPAPGPRTPPTGPGQRFRPRAESDMAGRDTGPARTPEPSFSGARAYHDAETPVARQATMEEAGPGFRNVFRIGLLRPRPIRGKAPVSASSGGYHEHGEIAVPKHGNGRNAQAFFATHGQPHDPARPEALQGGGHGGGQGDEQGQHHNAQGTHPVRAPRSAQPQPYMQPQMPAPYPAQHYSPPLHQAHAQYSGAPQYLPQIPQPALPTHAHHPAPYHPAQAYPPAYAAPQPGYAAAPAGHPYQAQPLQGMPAQPPHFYPQQQPAAMPWPSPQFHQPQPQPHFVPVHAPAWEQPAAPVASAPHQPTEPAAPARNPERPAPDNASVDRIRREMDELRSRIDGYGSDRRRA
ncbi:GNVR domain-containing protein [Hoeflea alexandrii]|uniref:GumC family protein n=1 Tax=Hoeflea alexandrii TaxID=288436 RepID=UPI0035CF1F55